MPEIKIDTGSIFQRTSRAFAEGAKIVIHKGGTGSGKTFDIMLFLFSLAVQYDNLIITVVSESRPHLEIGAIRILESVCKTAGLWEKNNWNISKAIWRSPTGSIIEFFSADRIGKALGARRTWLYGNEVNNIAQGVWDELARRSENVIADFNPTTQFWLENWISYYDGVKIIKSNYLDNPFLPETERNRIASRANKDKNFKRIHVDVEYGIAEGLIFSNWTQCEQMIEGDGVFGLDFGFSNDPSALIKVIDTPEAFYLDEQFYQTGMLNAHIISRFKALGLRPNYDEIIADSAEPKSIQEISLAGFNIKPAVKGPDSIRAGISALQSKPILVTKKSINLIKEFRQYSWALDKDGNPTNKPIDAYNHAIDATRYAISPKYRFKFAVK
jgi:phage terminase large subunit